MSAEKKGTVQKAIRAVLLRLHLIKKPLTPTQMTDNPYRRFYPNRKKK